MHWNYMRFPGGKPKALTFSYDDGVIQDERLIEMFEKYGVKGTFNLNSGMYPDEDFVYPETEWHRRNKRCKATSIYSKDCVEVAAHAYTHAHIGELPISVVTSEFLKDRQELESQFNRIVRGGCYPYGCVNENIMLAAKAAGLEYVRGDGCCYDFGLPANWLNWLPTCSHNYKELMPLAQKFTQDNVIKDPYLFYVWGHSYELDRDNTWDVMDDLLKTVSAKKDVWYATTGEIYDYVNAYNSLKYSCTGDMVFNPTNTEVCFECDFVPIKVKPGHTVKL